MKWLKWLKDSELPVSWRFESRGVFWRLLTSERGFIVGEDRDVQNKQVSFFCLDLKTGLPLWQQRTFDEQWWISIEVLHEQYVFLHKYSSPDLPDHKQIIALDLVSGNIVWTNNDCQLYFAYNDKVYASKTGFEDRRYFELNILDGEIIREISSHELETVRKSKERDYVQPILLPYTVDDSSGEEISSLVKNSKLSIGQPELIEYIEIHDLVVAGLHVPMHKFNESPCYHQHLVIFSRDGRVVFQDLINTDAKGIVPDGFFTAKGALYFIKNRNQLCAVNFGVE